MKNLKIILFLILFSQILLAQEKTVIGVVSDISGPLPFVNVIVKGTHIGTVTDFEGKYTIKATANDTLAFSYIETKTKTIRADKNEINVIIEYIDHSNDCIRRQYNFQIIHKKVPIYSMPVLRNYNNKIIFKRDLRTYKRNLRIAERNLKNKDNPKFNFKKSKNNGWLTIFQKDDCDYKKDESFQEKYKVIYSLPKDLSKEYVEAYNKLVFKHLNKKFKQVWQSEIRKDVFGLDGLIK